MKYLYYKFRLKPSKDQERILTDHCDAARFVYNQLLANNISYYESDKKFHFGISIVYESAKLRKEYDFLKLVNSQIIQQSAMNLGTAFKNIFSKKNKKAAGFPKFKSRRNNRQSFCVPQYFKVVNDKIKLPKIGLVEMINHRKISGKIKSITIIKEIDQWYASILCEQENKESPEINLSSVVGIDLGLKSFVVTSDGEVFNLPCTKKNIKKLKRLQRIHAKKKKDSKNRDKARIKVAKEYRRITRIKINYINNIVATITKSYDIVSIENLNISGMKKNKKLSGAIQQVPWYHFKTKLKEKAKSYYEVSRWLPSSKTCSGCGWVKKDLTLADRTFNCDSCGLEIDRDVNAAINLKTAATVGLACGESSIGVNGSDPETRYGLMKQEGDIVRTPSSVGSKISSL
jgi:putative transposase